MSNAILTIEEARDKISLVMTGYAEVNELRPVLKYLTELDESVKANVKEIIESDDLAFVRRQAS